MRHSAPRLIFLFFITLSALTAYSAPKKDAEAAPTISDSQVLRTLSTGDILEWERAQDEYQAGKSQYDTGYRLVHRPASSLRSQADIAKDKRDGQQLMKAGEAKMAEASTTLDALRAKASAAQQETVTVKSEAMVYPFELEPVSLKESLRPAAEKLLFTLWNAGYARIYQDKAYVIDTAEDEPVYIADPVLTKDLRSVIARLDGTRFTFVNDPEIGFEMKRENGSSYIDFPERQAILRNFKSALIVAELIYDSKQESALLSLRGIDLKSGTIVASQLAVLVVDDSVQALAVNGEMESTVSKETPKEVANAEDDSSETTSETEAQPSVGISKRLAVQLRDENNFLERVVASSTPYVFTIEYVGDQTGFDSRATSAIAKMILIEQNLYVSDNDFLDMAKGSHSEFDSLNEPRADTNAIWKITPLGGANEGRNAYDIEAISLIGGRTSGVPVGLMKTAFIIEDAPVGKVNE